MRFVDIQEIDAHFLERDVLVALAGESVHALTDTVDLRFELLARYAVVFVRIVKRGIQFHQDVVGDGIGRALLNADQAERRLLDDDGVPIVERSLGDEAAPCVACEVVLVGHQDAGGRVGALELVGELIEHVIRNNEHRLVDQAKPLLLHCRDDHFEGVVSDDEVVGHI